MPNTPQGWAVYPFVTWRDGVRAAVDGRLPSPLDYDGTPEGAFADSVAADLWVLDQGGQAIVDMLSPVTAANGQLGILGEFKGIPRRRATTTSYTVAADLASGASGVTIPAGTVASYTGVGGTTRWEVAETVTVDDGEDVTIRAQEAGSVYLPTTGMPSLTIVTPVSGLEGFTRDPSDAAQLGQDAQSFPSYRIALQRLPSSLGGTTDGWTRRILSVDFVTAADITTTAPSTFVVRVVPGSLTSAQETTLAQAIYDGQPAGAVYDTTASGTQVTADATDISGFPRSITWYEGVEEGVDAAVQIVLSSGYTANDGGDLDVVPSMESAYEALFAPLSVGGTLSWDDYYCAMAQVEGVARVITTNTVTWLDTSTSQTDVSPSAATNLLVPGTLTVTT